VHEEHGVRSLCLEELDARPMISEEFLLNTSVTGSRPRASNLSSMKSMNGLTYLLPSLLKLNRGSSGLGRT
jgi:hypothetical protein